MTKLVKKSDIKDLNFDQLIAWLEEHGIQPYRAKQILKWVHKGKADSFDSMTNIKKDFRHLLSTHFIIHRPLTKKVETSTDGSRKYLFELSDGKHVESVWIPEKTRSTLCISSQIGCAHGCAFCLTGAAGFIRNLTIGEIISQVIEVERDQQNKKRLTNIVFMGMMINTEYGLGYSGRKITLSTAGIVPKLNQLSKDTDASLAISLNATDNHTRNELMPINRTYPIEKLLEACRIYELKPRQKITFEYILIKGINDSDANAKRLSELLKPIKAKINIIPFNEYPGSDFKRPDESRINQFRDILVKNNYTVITRYSKGQDISAACGQLSVKV
ncbi:MAG: 23S rRNA (adenine(2503)-C(2))-methyltransferase RlmN [Deltaproteobacteria bacterium]|nr:23S rRNA (adenine(2503)-C(2))-methyltransferase RlmN [Deltaproteobacteria bacterium]